MRAGYMFPSGNYNIVLSKEELEQLVEKGHLTSVTNRIPCSIGRGVYNPSKKCIENHDKKDVLNQLFFRTDEDVADMSPGYQYVQYLCIAVSK